MKPGMILKPLLHLLVFVSTVVIENQMDINTTGRIPLYLPKKPEPLYMGMSFLGSRYQFPIQVV